jgi:hypothetical protein
MRLTSAVAAALSLFLSAPSFAQAWIEYSNRHDFFAVNFPGEPRVQETTFTSEHGGVFPSRIYTGEAGPSRYSLTVVDYTEAERVHKERAKGCPPDAQSGCAGSPATGPGSYKQDLDGVLEYASWQFIQRNAKVTYFGWSAVDLVEGRKIHLTNPDQSRTFVAIHVHENRLYMLEATVPRGSPEPGLFQQSLQFLDADGKTVRYQSTYSNRFPPPPKAR